LLAERDISRTTSTRDVRGRLRQAKASARMSIASTRRLRRVYEQRTVMRWSVRMEQHNVFNHQADIEKLAAAVHYRFLSEAEESRLVPERHAWTIDPAIKRAYDDLDDDAKASNRAAARRIPDHLALINFVVVPQVPDEDDSWRKPLAAAIEKHIDRLAQAEHRGWCAERITSGWTYAETRDNKLKRHHLLVDWAKLSPSDQDKDRSSARSIPDLLDIAGFKAVPV
jgi:hypothetical protein